MTKPSGWVKTEAGQTPEAPNIKPEIPAGWVRASSTGLCSALLHLFEVCNVTPATALTEMVAAISFICVGATGKTDEERLDRLRLAVETLEANGKDMLERMKNDGELT